MKRNETTICLQLMQLVKPLAGHMIAAVSMGLAGHLCAAFLTILAGYGILYVLGFSAFSLPVLFACMAVLAILRGVLRYAEQACNHFIAFKLLALIRDKVFGALRNLCPARLEGRNRGDLIALITSDIELLEVFYAHTISPVCIAVLFSILLCLFIGSFHPLLGILALCAYLAVGLAVPMLIHQISQKDGIKFRAGAGALSSFVLESLRGLDETIQYQDGKNRLAQMEAKSASLAQTEGRMKHTTGLNTAITNAVILVFDLLMLVMASMLYEKGAIGFDGVVISLLALMSSFGPVTALAALGSTLQNTFAAGSRVLDLLEETPQAEAISGQPAARFAGASVHNLSFAYGNEMVLENFSIQLPRNQIIGIHGKSGSGKSTFLKLLMRFWKTEQGSIQVSSRDIETINTVDLRDMESFVTQETHLFHDSIFNNLRVAKLDATLEEMMDACKKASIHDFIMSLPQGYDTQVGELGDTLSGGQRQRLGLARAFLHDAPLMLLDEPTSSLDSLNEAMVLQAIDAQRENKTVVLVSHRASTMRIADRIFCTENGRNS